MTDFSAFLENLIQFGLEFFRKFYGVYRAEVADVADPEKRGRIRIVCYDVGHTEPLGVWVDPAFPGAASQRGVFWPPEVGDTVWVVFDAGDPSLPKVYFGGWFGAPDDTSEVPQDLGYSGDAPTRRGLQTKSGHEVVFDDEEGKEAITVRWKGDAGTQVEINKDGTLTLQAGGSTLQFDAPGGKATVQDGNGNTITLENGKITVEASGTVDVKGQAVNIRSTAVTLGDGGAPEPLAKGQTLYNWLLSHTHGSAVGPTTPPVAPLPPSVLSQTVKTK